jgi:hypothetical protein
MIANIFIIVKHIACSLFLICSLFYCNTLSATHSITTNKRSLLKIYDGSRITYVQNNDYLHVGIKKSGSIFYPIFAAIGTQQAAVKFLAIKSMVINGIYVEADIHGSNTKTGLSTKQSALMLESNYSVKINNGLIVTAGANIYGYQGINSEAAGIVIALPLVSNIINHGHISGNYGIVFKKNGYLEGTITNFNKIIAHTAIGSTNKKSSTTNNISIINKDKGFIRGAITLEGANNKIENHGIITSMSNSSFISKGVRSTINNSGTISLYNIMPSTTKNYLYLNNEGYIYTEKNLVINSLYNKHNITANLLAVLNEATNSKNIVVNKLYISNSITINNTQFKTTATKFTNLTTGNIVIKQDNLVASDSILSNQGSIDVKKTLILSGTLTNNGKLIARQLLADNQKLIINQSATSIFHNLGSSNSKINIINYGRLTIGGYIQRDDNKAFISGDITIHKDSNCNRDGIINLVNNITQTEGMLDIGSIVAATDTNLMIEDKAIAICNKDFLDRHLAISNEGVLQLEASSSIKQYYSLSGLLIIKLNTNSIVDIKNKKSLLNLDSFFNIDKDAKIKIIPPKKITKDISTKLYTVYATPLTVMSFGIYKGNFIEKSINGSTELYLTNMNVEGGYLTGKVIIQSLIGYFPDTEYAMQTLVFSKLFSMGVAWKCNKSNQQATSNNLIVSPNVLAMEAGQLNFNCTTKDLIVGSQTTKDKFACNTKHSLPAILIGTTVAIDDKFIVAATTEQLNINSISFFNIETDGRNELGEREDIRNKDAIVINGRHPLHLNGKDGLLLDQSMLIKAGATSCGLNITASMTGNITNNTTIGDSLTGVSIGVNNYFKGNITNNGTLDAVNYAIYVNPKKYGNNNIADFSIDNKNYINGNIYFDVNRSGVKSIYLNNYGHIIANTITNKGDNPLHIINRQNSKMYATEISATTIENYGNININSKLFSNKYCTFLNRQNAVATIANMYLDKLLINDGELILTNLFSNGNTITNNDVINVDTIKNIDVINYKAINIYKGISGKVNIDNNASTNILTIADIVTTNKGTQFTTNGIQIAKNAKLINNKNSTINIKQPADLVINNNIDNYGDIAVDNSIYFSSNFTNNGTITANTITSINNSCVYNRQANSLFCSNLGSNNAKLVLVGNLNISNNATNTNISGDILLHANRLRKHDGKIALGNNLQQLIINGSFYLGGISSTPKAIDLVINKNSVCDFSLPLINNNLSIINEGSIDLLQNSVINNYNSKNGQLSLSIMDVNNTKNGLLHVLNSATFDANSVINLRYCDSNKLSKQTIAVVKFKKLSNVRSLTDLVKFIKVGSILLTVTKTMVINNVIITEISPTDFTTANPNITIASQLLYKNIVKPQVSITGKAWKINKDVSSIHFTTNNLIVSPPSLLDVKDIIVYDKKNKLLIIKSNSPQAIKLNAYGNNNNYPPLVIGTTVATDTNFTVINNNKLEFNSILIDNLLIDGSHKNHFVADTDAIVINGDAPIKARLTIGYAATITAGNSSSVLRIIPSFNGDIINYGIMGSSDSNNCIALDNFPSGSLNNENKIIARNAAIYLNAAKNQQNKNFVINNNGEINGSIIIEATKITDYFVVTINNNKLISSNTITSNEKIYTTLNNMHNAEVNVSYFDIDKVNNKGVLHLQQQEYKISDRILTQSGDFYAKNIIIDGAFTNAGNMYVTSLVGANYTKKIINNGMITTDNIENITIDNKGILKVKSQINGRVLVSNTVTMFGNIVVSAQASATLGILKGNYQLINKGKARFDNLIVDRLKNSNNAYLKITDNIELTSNSDNYGSIKVKNLVIKSGTFTNHKHARLKLTNNEDFIIGGHSFNNIGILHANKIKVLNNFSNNGNIFTHDLITDAQQIINNSRCLLSWKNIKANNDLDIINKGSLVFAPSRLAVIHGTITIHKDSNKAQDGKLKILGTPYIYNKLTIGEIEGSTDHNTIYIQPSGKLVITLPLQQRNTSIENSGELSLCTGSDINSYTAKDKSAIYFKVKNIGQNWLYANSIQFHDGCLIYISPEKSFTIGNVNKVRIITSNSKILNTREGGSNALLNSTNIKERVLYLDKHNCILRLSNIEITDKNMSVMADIHILDHSKTTYNMLYADQLLIPSLLGYPLATNHKEIVGVTWLSNFYKKTNNPQSNNLIISPVSLLQDNQLKYDTTKKVLTIGLSKYSVKRIKNHPGIVIGSDVNPGGVFVKSKKGTKNLILDSIHINNITIISGSNSVTKKSKGDIDTPTFEDGIVITGNNNIKLTNAIGLILGSNTNVISNSESCLNFAVAFLGNVNNFSSINAIGNARAIKINQFFEGTITNKNIIRAENIALEIKAENVKEYFGDIKQDVLQYITVVNEATISGDIFVRIQKRFDDRTFVNFLNKGYFLSNNFISSGNLEMNIINNKSATLTIGVLDGYLNKIINYGCLQVGSITENFLINNNNFSNYNVAKLGTCIIAGSLTNNAILHINNLISIQTNKIYNYNYLQLGNIYNGLTIGNSGTLVINGECVKGRISIDGTLTVNQQLKTLNKCSVSCKKMDIFGDVINNKGCSISVYSNLILNNNFINYGVLAVSGKLSLLDDFNNHGSVYAQYLVGNNKKINVVERQKAIFGNIGEYNNNIYIINNGSLTIKSLHPKTAKLQGNINIKDSSYLKFSNFIIEGNIEQISGVLFAKSFSSEKNSAIAIKPKAVMVFTDTVREKQVAINNQGYLELAHNSVFKSYNGAGGSLSIAITTFANKINTPLLLIEDIATFNKNSQIELKYIDQNIPDADTGMVVDILYAKKGLFNKDFNLKKLIANDIIKNITVAQVSANIRLSIESITITNNAITAHISAHDISKLYGDLHPASQKLIEHPNKFNVYGIAWGKNKINNKFSNNNLIISPSNVAIDSTLIRFATVTNILQVGSYRGMKSIFVSGSEAALIVGNDILLDSFFSETNNTPVQLDKINIDNIVVDGSIDNFDYSIINKDGVLINGGNGFILTNGFIVGPQARIVAGASSTALNISTTLKADVTNNGIIGGNYTGYGVLLRNAIDGLLTNNGIINGNIAALNYDEYNVNNDISFNIVNLGTVTGSLLFNSNKTKRNIQKINLYNSKTIIAKEISATEYTNINIYNKRQAMIIAEKINVSLLKNEGLVTVTGNENFKINSYNFINNNTVVASNILLIGEFRNNGSLQAYSLDGNHNTIKNNGYLQVNNIKNIKIESLSNIDISESIEGRVVIDNKIKLSETVVVNKDATLISEHLFSDDKLINHGEVYINQDAIISILINQKSSKLQVKKDLIINDYSENYGKIIARSIKCQDCKLSNLANGYIKVTGKNGFIVDEKSFENNNQLVVDNKIIITSDFINNGQILAGHLQSGNIDFTINKKCGAQFKNIDNTSSYLNIINKGRLIIGTGGYDASIVSGNVLVVKDKTKSFNADVIAENNITQKSGVLHAGALLSKTGINYSVNDDAIAIFNNKVSKSIRFINSGVLAIRANSNIKEYYSEDGVLILTLTGKHSGSTLLQASNNIYLTKNSKIIVNSIGKLGKYRRKYSRVAILSAKKGIIYKDFNYKSNDFDDMIFAVSTSSILLKASDIVATNNAIYANILQLNVTDFNNIGYANKTLTKILLGDCQKYNSSLEGVSWENIDDSFNQVISKKIVVAPHELYDKYKSLKLTSSGIEVGSYNKKSKNSVSVLINFISKQLSPYEIASRYTQYLLNPLIYSKYPDLSKMFLMLKNRNMEDEDNLKSRLLLPELFTGKVYNDFEKTITIKSKINIRKSEQINANKDAIIIAGDIDKVSGLKAINIEATAKLLTYATADALHIAIPCYANINNIGIIGDQHTGCGLKITQPISTTITNNNIISGKKAIVVDISKNIAEIPLKVCLNNKGVIYGSIISNSLDKTQLVTLNNFNTVIAATITENKNSNISISNDKYSFIESNYMKISSLHNYGLINVNNIYNCKNTVNEGTINVHNELFVGTSLVNKSVISSTSIIGKQNSIIINENKIVANKLGDILIANKNNAVFTVKNSIIGRVTITGGIHISENVSQTGVLLVDKIIPENSSLYFSIQSGAICNLTKAIESPNLNIENYGSLNIQHGSIFNNYISNGGEIIICTPSDIKSIDRSLLYIENTASFNTYKGNLPRILLAADIPPGYNQKHLTDNKKSLIKIITSKKILFNGYDFDDEMENVLSMKAINSGSIFIRITNPYVSRENGKEILYALLGLEKINNVIDLTKYPISVKRLAVLMQEKQLTTDQQKIIDIVATGIKNKYLPKESENIVSYFLQDNQHTNIYNEEISKIQKKIESCLTKQKSDLINVVASLIPDTPSIDMSLDTSVATSILATINNNFIKNRLEVSKATGVNSSPYYSKVPIWHSCSFVKTQENYTTECRSYNKWRSHLLNVGFDDQLTKSVTVGAIVSYAQTSIIPITNSYNNSMRHLNSVLASCYLQYTSRKIQTNLVFILANNFHRRDHRYHIIDKEYHTQYTTKLYGGMLELAYPCQYKKVTIDLATAVKIFSDRIPGNNLGLYEKHAKICFNKAEYSVGVSISQEFYVVNNLIINYAVSAMYSYNINISGHKICTNVLGKNFIFRVNSPDKNQIAVNFNLGLNIKKRLNINCGINGSKQNNKSSFGATFTTKYMF